MIDRIIIVMFTVFALVGACTPAQLQTAQADIAAAKPVVNAAACDAQAAANVATQAFTAAGNMQDASSTAFVSTILGQLCFTVKPAQ